MDAVMLGRIASLGVAAIPLAIACRSGGTDDCLVMAAALAVPLGLVWFGQRMDFVFRKYQRNLTDGQYRIVGGAMLVLFTLVYMLTRP